MSIAIRSSAAANLLRTIAETARTNAPAAAEGLGTAATPDDQLTCQLPVEYAMALADHLDAIDGYTKLPAIAEQLRGWDSRFVQLASKDDIETISVQLSNFRIEVIQEAPRRGVLAFLRDLFAAPTHSVPPIPSRPLEWDLDGFPIGDADGTRFRWLDAALRRGDFLALSWAEHGMSSERARRYAEQCVELCAQRSDSDDEMPDLFSISDAEVRQ